MEASVCAKVGGLRRTPCAQSVVIRDKWLADAVAGQDIRTLGYVAGEKGWAGTSVDFRVRSWGQMSSCSLGALGQASAAEG